LGFLKFVVSYILMGTWTTPSTRATDFLVTAEIWNDEVVNNLLDLRDPLLDQGTQSDTIDNTGTWTDVSGPGEISLTLDTGQVVLVNVVGRVEIDSPGTNDYVKLAIYLNSTDHHVFFDTGVQSSGGSPYDITNRRIPISAVYMFSLDTGTHTFKIRNKYGVSASNFDIDLYHFAVTKISH